MKTVLVTGATGFIGQNLCRLLSEMQVDLHVLGRTRPEFSAKFHVWDMEGCLDSDVLSGIDTVFHLAGKAHALEESRQDAREYFRINTEATEELLLACKKSGVKTFVYFSSVKATGDSEVLTDESCLSESDTPYGQSKRASEKLVLKGGYVPHPVVIRPSMVYGNTEKGNLPKMIRAVWAGKFPPLPETHNKRSMVHVDDLVRAAILAAEKPEAAGKVYIVTDSEAYSTRQIYEWICEALHKPVPVWNIPFCVMKLFAKLGDMIGLLRGRRFSFDSDALGKLTGSACYSSEKIARELGFRAKRNLRDALPEISRFLGLTK
ncbi:MAG: NAD-dependent dehydratase [Zetaproteobacteria bacterium CG12_big_fil_rev_8_21_14_0_65_55_1124]|nr:MAG: NAD-dependent dehydratase [Zetaproteobacteria bacterium CG08_land_8_20_14_0_20_55_17]PIW43090.1 MAG: NAD-dependent dehydratase [Zetaproteobacteria bacterium CG12_big_fil_rev_8_21_14_0_65_55_1124]PIY52257.1 MAG: NAD-dependent dehydratase [Zetaproteobacteria bacterium CG_4_10_14_0_8_um_filter_55_43]PIZ38748.1 MAG: NAD-dependent dehydratase [Zetaproteobacteria bacterium CG_4_10_14_0_2_um_filter_55_20]PJB82017.1 MAG: NAD-dependent dehydratase [Zetaproteobacteria bacterium CG_4_9_14_0_8_um_f